MAEYLIDNAPGQINFQGDDFLQRTLQNAKNLLMCRVGEVPYDRSRGFNAALFDLPMEQFMEELLPELDRVMIYEPDVEVVDANARQLEDGSIYIQVTIEIDREA